MYKSNRSLVAVGLLLTLAVVAAAYAFQLPPDVVAGSMILANAPVGLPEIKSMVEAQGRQWEEFKKTNDERLDKLAKGEAVADLEAKLASIEQDLQTTTNEVKDLLTKANRPGAPTGQAGDKLAAECKSFNATVAAHAAEKGRQFQPLTVEQYGEYKSTFSTWLRKGDANLEAAERKTINVGSDPQGGYLVGEERERGVDRVVGQYSAMRSVARVIPIGAATYKRLVKTSGLSGGKRGGENTAPTEGTSPGWAELEFKPGTYISDQRITSEALEDAVQDVESDLMMEMGIEFAEMEGYDFWNGSGVNGPRGLLSYDMVANASYAWGKVGFVVSGGASGFAASNPSDALITLQHALKRQYRANATWMMTDATLGAIRRFKDGQGIYLWAPSGLQNGMVGQLLGHPVMTDDFAPDLGSDTFPVLFGDFQRAYTIVDRRGMTVLRDPFTAVPHVKFVGRRRVGGGVSNFEAVKALKCST